MTEEASMSCEHSFCRACWESYLTLKISEGDAHHISCPAFNCDILVPVEVIENLVTPDVARRYLQFDIKVSFLAHWFIRRSPTMYEKYRSRVNAFLLVKLLFLPK